MDGDGQMVAASISAEPVFAVDDRIALFATDQYLEFLSGAGVLHTPFDISPDDRRFLMVRRAGTGDGAPPTEMILVENWFEELKEKVAR